MKKTVATGLMKDTRACYPLAVDFRKTYYVLPNLFTLSSVLCGFASLALSASGRSGEDLYLAALAICFGLVFDTFDGRVARLTKTQTDLGRDLDSLADVITFGAAPALLVYKWGLIDFGYTGIFIAGLFVCAGALRLARFNVLSRRSETSGHKNPGKFTLGLSIPPAASLLVFMVIVSHNSGEYRLVSETSLAAIVLVLSFLMVSRVRFRSFKELRLSLKTASVLLLILSSSAAWWMAGFAKAFIFLFLVLAYIVLGLAEEVLFYRRRRAQERSAKQPPAPEPPSETDEEVLRELGAFDEDDQEKNAETSSNGKNDTDEEDEKADALPSGKPLATTSRV
jgi:CDP-diacylglycerol--serine O-phosphatidyltransferase